MIKTLMEPISSESHKQKAFPLEMQEVFFPEPSATYLLSMILHSNMYFRAVMALGLSIDHCPQTPRKNMNRLFSSPSLLLRG